MRVMLVAALGGVFLFSIMPVLAEAQTEEQLAARAQEEAPEEDTVEWKLNLGAVFNTGNTESWTITAGTNFQWVEGPHVLLFESGFNYSRADLEGDMTGPQTNARNLNSRLRYDYFFTEMDAGYYSLKHRWDTFAGLDTRIQNQLGYLRNFFKEEKHRFWGETGYDLTFDNRHPDPLPNPEFDPMMPMAEPQFLEDTVLVHAARLFVGYDNHLNEHVHFITGGEVLLNFQEAEDVRFNYDAQLTSTVADRLAVDVRFRLQFDNVPVPGRKELDTTTTLSLIYSLM